jgi:adenylate kinase
VPDAVVIGMIRSALETNPDVKGFLFDGFPRTPAQAAALDELMELKGTSINTMLAMEVSEQELMIRLLKRGETSGRSDDTNEEVVKARITEYHNKTAAVADYYHQFGKVVTVKGEGSIEAIFNSLCKEIDQKI